MNGIGATWDQWRVLGMPRCYSYDFTRRHQCGRVIWPWQRASGDGENATHARCQTVHDASFARLEPFRDFSDATDEGPA